MIAQLLSKLGPDEIIELHNNLNELARRYECRGSKAAFNLVKKMMAEQREKDKMIEGYYEALNDVHDKIRDKLLFDKKD